MRFVALLDVLHNTSIRNIKQKLLESRMGSTSPAQRFKAVADEWTFSSEQKDFATQLWSMFIEPLYDSAKKTFWREVRLNGNELFYQKNGGAGDNCRAIRFPPYSRQLCRTEPHTKRYSVFAGPFRDTASQVWLSFNVVDRGRAMRNVRDKCGV